MLKWQIENNDVSSIQLKLWTQVDVDAETTLEKFIINRKHVHVQVCKFKTFKELLPRPRYNRNAKSNVEPLPKRQHSSTSNDVSIVDVSQEEPKFAHQMTKETQLTIKIQLPLLAVILVRQSHVGVEFT